MSNPQHHWRRLGGRGELNDAEGIERPVDTGGDPVATQTGVIARAFRCATENPLDTTREIPPREYLLRRLVGTQMHQFAPRAVASVLASAGGTGKSMALLQLAVCLVTGRPWFGFEVNASAAGQRVLLVLAEEPEIEIARRLKAICDHMQLDDLDREVVRRQVVAVPMAGEPCAMARMDRDGQLHKTQSYQELIDALHSDGPPWSMIALDPLARLFPAAETSNELATFSVQLLEALTRAPGSPLVMLAHHSSKMARRAASVDSRGVSGLEDAVRWLLTMLRKPKAIELRQSKANYSIALDEPLMLQAGDGGVLRLLTEDEQTEQADRDLASQTESELAALEAAVDRLVGAIEQHGPSSSLELLAKRAGVRKQTAGVALKLAIEQGRIEMVGTARVKQYRLPEIKL